MTGLAKATAYDIYAELKRRNLPSVIFTRTDLMDMAAALDIEMTDAQLDAFLTEHRGEIENAMLYTWGAGNDTVNDLLREFVDTDQEEAA